MVDSKTEAIEAEMAMPNYFGKAIFYREPKSKLERAEMSRCRHAGLILSRGPEFKFLSRDGVSDSIPRPISSRSLCIPIAVPSLPRPPCLVGTRIPKILEPPQTAPENGAVPYPAPARWQWSKINHRCCESGSEMCPLKDVHYGDEIS